MFEKNFSDYLFQKNIPVRRVLYPGAESLLEFCYGTSVAVDKISEKMAFNAGTILAKFHDAAKGFNVPPLPNRKLESELLRAIMIKDKLQDKYTNGTDFISIVEHLLQSVFLKASDTCIIHNDFRVQNVLFQDENISAILDFDWSCVGNPLKDLGHALVEWSFPDGGKFNQKIFKSFFDGYVMSKTEVDIDALKYWIEFSCISDTATYLCDTIDDMPSGGEILSWMFGKYLFFNGQDIAKLTE
jgi:Ser/Thr protein kinase RdoA (MazF antagonist)